jgi:hypothetical protein
MTKTKIGEAGQAGPGPFASLKSQNSRDSPSQSRMQTKVNTPASMPKMIMKPSVWSSNLDPTAPPIMALASIPNTHMPKVRISLTLRSLSPGLGVGAEQPAQEDECGDEARDDDQRPTRQLGAGDRQQMISAKIAQPNGPMNSSKNGLDKSRFVLSFCIVHWSKGRRKSQPRPWPASRPFSATSS